MTNLELLTDDEIKAMSYDSFNIMDLKAMQSMSKVEYPRYTVAMAHTIYLWELFLLNEARLLSKDYVNGYWLTDNGFWILQTELKFNVQDCWGGTYQLNATEFSIVVNLFALSKLSITTYDKQPAVNRRAVFFSDYIKEVMNKNRDFLNTSAIYKIID